MEKLPVMREDELLQRVQNGRYVLFFTADWCPDCQAIKPAMPAIERDFSADHFYLVDRDENIDLAADLNIFGIPSFVVFQDGQEIGRFVNKERKSKQQVEDFLRDLK
ncbi:MAG TPA: thioredoxin family protein [Candidatus Limosilactobacillus intestinigallinarum]|jgi:thiol-disulfide isomerase/thioredoxin|nr:thioredoxin family protein [Candidatus Limosilactobacillus intestinigallinarum]